MKDLAQKVFDTIADRSAWEDKQRVFWEMRHEGLPRINKPFPTAADLHFPLIDMTMRKIKPFWWQALSSNGNLTQFISKRQQSDELTTGASNWLDFRLRHESDFQDKAPIALTRMLLRGRGVIGAFVDPLDGYRLKFRVPDPMMVVVERNAPSLEEADWFVVIKHMTRDAYLRDRRYDRRKEVVARICGRNPQNASDWLSDKADREGLTYSKHENIIVIYEHWVKTMGGHTIHEYAPADPDVVIRKPRGNPYKWQGKESFPWVDFPMELEDEGWLAPRGIAEILAPFESYACKLWNEKADSMTYYNRPMLTTTDGTMPNSNAVRFEPGEIVPGNLRSVNEKGPPISFDQEIGNVRMLGEQLVLMPDFGVTDAQQTKGEPRTATENQRIANLMDTATGYNVEILRRRLTRLYTHIWAMELQFADKRTDWSYLADDAWSALTMDAIHDGYLVQPGGSADSWNKNANFKKAVMQLKTLANHPNANQEELAKDVIAANDPAKVKTHFIPTNLRAANEMEDEAHETLILLEGYPAAVAPHEDHYARAKVLLGKLAALNAEGRPVNPVGRQRLQEHLAVHMQYLQKINPQQAKQLQAEIMAFQQQQMTAMQPTRTAAEPAMSL